MLNLLLLSSDKVNVLPPWVNQAARGCKGTSRDHRDAVDLGDDRPSCVRCPPVPTCRGIASAESVHGTPVVKFVIDAKRVLQNEARAPRSKSGRLFVDDAKR